MIQVRQYYGKNLGRKFYVKDPKKIEFWKSLSLANNLGIITRIRMIS